MGRWCKDEHWIRRLNHRCRSPWWLCRTILEAGSFINESFNGGHQIAWLDSGCQSSLKNQRGVMSKFDRPSVTWARMPMLLQHAATPHILIFFKSILWPKLFLSLSSWGFIGTIKSALSDSSSIAHVIIAIHRLRRSNGTTFWGVIFLMNTLSPRQQNYHLNFDWTISDYFSWDILLGLCSKFLGTSLDILRNNIFLKQ